MTKYRISCIEHYRQETRRGGREMTSFQLFKLVGSAYVFVGQKRVNGVIKTKRGCFNALKRLALGGIEFVEQDAILAEEKQ